MRNFAAFFITSFMTFCFMLGVAYCENVGLSRSGEGFELSAALCLMAAIISFFYGLVQQSSDNDARRKRMSGVEDDDEL